MTADLHFKSDSKAGFLKKIRNYFTAGILIIAPTAVSFWVLAQIFRWFDNILGKWFDQLFNEVLSINETLGIQTFHIPGLGAITLAIIVIFIGMMARLYVGKKFFAMWEKIINYVPLINRIYLAVRQLSDSFAKGDGVIFQRPVMVEYPRIGAYSIGFVTRDCEDPFCRVVGKKVSSVFIPTTPNPTSGVLIFFPQEDLIPLNMTVEDSMKLIISAGKLSPDIKLPVHYENGDIERLF